MPTNPSIDPTAFDDNSLLARVDRMLTRTSADLTVFGDDGLLARVDSLRTRLAYEPNADARLFVSLLLDDTIAECRRRYLQRTAEMAAEQRS